MSIGRLEHVNLSVSRPERMAQLLKELCGWEERWSGKSLLGGDTIHVGEPHNGGSYIAVYTNDNLRGKTGLDFAKGAPLNHVALLVDDIEQAEKTVIAAGLTPENHGDYEPGKRFYFYDWDGIEFEIVSYEGEAA